VRPTFFTNQRRLEAREPHYYLRAALLGRRAGCATCHTTAGNYAAYSVPVFTRA
jgi:hypothetical protein